MKKGMSLIEVLVGSIILAIVIVATMNIFGVNHKLMSTNKKYFLAEQIIRERIEIIKHGISIQENLTNLEAYVSSMQTIDTLSSQLENGHPITFTFQSSFIKENITASGMNSGTGIMTPFIYNVKTIVTWDNGKDSIIVNTIM